MKKLGLVSFTKILLNIIFASGIFICIFLPFIFKYVGNYFVAYKTYYYEMCAIYMLAGGLALWILWQLRIMIQTVIDQNCFKWENVQCLKKMGIASFAISFLFIISMFFHISFAILIIILVFLIAGLFSFVLSRVFKEAVTYKEENDLTI